MSAVSGRLGPKPIKSSAAASAFDPLSDIAGSLEVRQRRANSGDERASPAALLPSPICPSTIRGGEERKFYWPVSNAA